MELTQTQQNVMNAVIKIMEATEFAQSLGMTLEETVAWFKERGEIDENTEGRIRKFYGLLEASS